MKTPPGYSELAFRHEAETARCGSIQILSERKKRRDLCALIE